MTDPPPSTSRLGTVVVPCDSAWNSASRFFGKMRVVSEPVSAGTPPSPPRSVYRASIT